MAVRKAYAYSKRKFTPYTRKSKVKRLSYIKTVPPQKIVKFNMGNISAYNKGKFKNVIKIVAAHNVQVRDLALEAVRQRLHNNLQKRLMLENYYLVCKPFPHQILRDNKTFSGGTKGERVQTGMKHSFGSTVGRAAPVKAGKSIFEIHYFNKKDTDFVRKLCKSTTPKLPCKTKIIYEHLE
jgi:large subunit ribosomal protein L10e